jgi:DNA processing protein
MPDDLAYWVALHSVRGMGPATFQKLLAAYGEPAKAVLNAQRRHLAMMPRIPTWVVDGILSARDSLEEAQAQIAGLARRGIKIMTMRDEQYPGPLRKIANPPPVLYCHGDLTEADVRGIGIVGATNPSAHGADVANRFARIFARHDHTVVSGYARGIDSAAHLGALAARGRTVLVIPMGINRFESHHGFPPAEVLARHGAIVSEQPPDVFWTVEGALARNRLTVALSRALLVVETAEEGGTMHTFNLARREGRPIFVVTYRHPPKSASGNKVAIERGGVPIGNFSDIHKIMEALEASDA